MRHLVGEPVKFRGFTLVELAIVLMIVGIIAVMTLGATSTALNVQRAEATRSKMRSVETALANFVAVNRRLPCPASGQLNAGTELGAPGTAVSDPCGSQRHGVVPWTSLGLSAADGEDAWGTRLTYRVDTVLTRPNAMDMSMCDPAGAHPAPPTDGLAPARISCDINCSAGALASCVTPTAFLAGRGLEVRDSVGGTILMNPAAGPATGAAYVLISHGENRAAGYDGSGNLLSGAATVGTAELHNAADAVPPAYYVDAPANFSTTNARFDDFVIRPTVMAVAQRAYLGPRSH